MEEEKTKEYSDRIIIKAKDDIICVMKELEKIDHVVSSPNYRRHGLYIDTVSDNAIMLRSSAFSESDPRNLNQTESINLIKYIKEGLERKKSELDMIINA